MRRDIPTAIILLFLLTIACPSHVRAQDGGYRYTVRDFDGGYTFPAEGEDPPPIDVSGDRQPMRVIQGRGLAWLASPDAPPRSVDDAAVVYEDHVPVQSGPAGMLVRGWTSPGVAAYDSFTYALTRVDDDGEVAGHPAEQYELRAFVERTGEPGDSDQRFRVAARFWVLPDIPFSWAPFGFGTQTLPALMPRLREELGPRLEELGLVGRAAVSIDFAVFRDGDEAGGSRQVTGFEISDLQSTSEVPRLPGPAVDQVVIDRLGKQMTDSPGDVCTAATDGELPPLDADLPPEAREALADWVTAGCSSPDLYLVMLEETFRSDPEAFCDDVTAAGDAAALADAVFTAPQREAFMTLLGPDQRQGFRDQLLQYCRR